MQWLPFCSLNTTFECLCICHFLCLRCSPCSLPFSVCLPPSLSGLNPKIIYSESSSNHGVWRWCSPHLKSLLSPVISESSSNHGVWRWCSPHLKSLLSPVISFLACNQSEINLLTYLLCISLQNVSSLRAGTFSLLVITISTEVRTALDI